MSLLFTQSYGLWGRHPRKTAFSYSGNYVTAHSVNHLPLSQFISVYLLIPKVYESFPYVRLWVIKICMIERLGGNTIVSKCVPIEKDGFC